MSNFSKKGAAEEGTSEVDVFDFAAKLWRGRYTICLSALVFLILGGGVAFYAISPRYQSVAQVVLQVDGQNVVDIESVVSGVSAESSALNTELQIMKSREVIKRVVLDLNLDRDPEFNPSILDDHPNNVFWERIRTPFMTEITPDLPKEEQVNLAISNLSRSVRVSNVRDTYIFEIAVTTLDPSKSQRLANKIVETYIDNQVGVKFSNTEAAIDWLSQRVVDLEAELGQREQEINNYKSSVDIATPEALAVLNSRLTELRDRVYRTRESVSVLRDELEAISDIKKSRNLADARKLLGGHQSLTIAESYDALSGRVESLYSATASRLKASQNQLDSLVDSLDVFEAEVSERSVEFQKLQQMEREARSLTTLYETFLGRLKEASVQRGLHQADARVLSAAISGVYVSPNKPAILVLSLMVGLIIGISVSIFRDAREGGFRTGLALQNHTRVNLIGEVPLVKVKSRSGLLGYIRENPTSALVESIRNLRTSVLMSDVESPPQVIMSTSSLPGEGKTTTSLALAQSLAEMGKRTLVIECDIRRRTFSNYFSVSEEAHGFGSAILGRVNVKSVVCQYPEVDADVIVGDRVPVSAADVFSSQKFEDTISLLRKEYDFIILDTPPVLVVPDARIIGRVADAIIYSVRWKATSYEQVTEGLRQLNSVGLEVFGVILSQVNLDEMSEYGGRYGSYRKYGSAYYDT